MCFFWYWIIEEQYYKNKLKWGGNYYSPGTGYSGLFLVKFLWKGLFYRVYKMA